MAQVDSTRQWKGPSVKEMIETHTLGKMIIEHQDGPVGIFDDDEITRLRRFVQDPAAAKDLLREYGMQDADGDKPGTGAGAKGSLAGYIVAMHGTDESVLTAEDIVALKEWFAQGHGKRSDEQ